jgi:hypothetical protein
MKLYICSFNQNNPVPKLFIMFYQIYILTTKDFLDNNRTLFGPDLLASTLYVGDFL